MKLINERRQLINIIETSHKQMVEMNVKMQRIEFTSSMMMYLLRDLLDLARMDRSIFTLASQNFDLYQAIDKAILLVQTNADAKGVRLVPPAQSSESHLFRQILSDEHRYMQVLQNFLTNAIKFSSRGSKVEILLNLVETQNDTDGSQGVNSTEQSLFISFDLTVRDHGHGISEENQKNLFINFSKLDDPDNVNKSGLGLGLSICRDMVQQMGGYVKVKSEVGKGTDFIIHMKTKCKIDSAATPP